MSFLNFAAALESCGYACQITNAAMFVTASRSIVQSGGKILILMMLYGCTGSWLVCRCLPAGWMSALALAIVLRTWLLFSIPVCPSLLPSLAGMLQGFCPCWCKAMCRGEPGLPALGWLEGSATQLCVAEGSESP